MKIHWSRLGPSVGMRFRAFLYLTLFRGAYDATIAQLPRITSTALVLGSSPSAKKPASLQSDWFVVSINGSQVVGEAFGVDVPDLTVMRNGIARPGPHADAVWQALSGRRTRHLVSNISSEIDRGLGELIAQRSYSADRVTEISRHVRGAIIAETIGRYWVSLSNRTSISNGMFAVLLALKLGAPEVVIAGMSFAHAGQFFGSDKNFPRSHVPGDRNVCRRIVELGLPVFTEDEDFARDSGLPLRPAR